LNLDARLLLPAELDSVLTEVKEQKIGLIVRPVQASDPDWYLSEIAEAATAGSSIGVAAGDAAELRSTIALLVGQGIKPQRALRMLTTEAASCVGMPKGAATIAVGQPADLVIWSGPPYKLTSRCLGVLSDGKMIGQDDSDVETSTASTSSNVTSS
ncbi:MAG: amidohydrolase family protein, partial [Planctomycetota bacterium]